MVLWIRPSCSSSLRFWLKVLSETFLPAWGSALLCVDDDMRMEALRQTNYVKSIVTAQGKMDLERKGKQSYQGWMCARLLAFSVPIQGGNRGNPGAPALCFSERTF